MGHNNSFFLSFLHCRMRDASVGNNSTVLAAVTKIDSPKPHVGTNMI